MLQANKGAQWHRLGKVFTFNYPVLFKAMSNKVDEDD